VNVDAGCLHFVCMIVYTDGTNCGDCCAMHAPCLSPSLRCGLQGALSAGHQHTKVPGSATACVIQLDPENKTLEAANLVSCSDWLLACCSDRHARAYGIARAWPGSALQVAGPFDSCPAPGRTPSPAYAADCPAFFLLAQGDSGFIVIRNKRAIAKSRPLQHYFDCPLQFGAFPEFVEATDTADMADTYSIPLAPGDVIVAGVVFLRFLADHAR